MTYLSTYLAIFCLGVIFLLLLLLVSEKSLSQDYDLFSVKVFSAERSSLLSGIDSIPANKDSINTLAPKNVKSVIRSKVKSLKVNSFGVPVLKNASSQDSSYKKRQFPTDSILHGGVPPRRIFSPGFYSSDGYGDSNINGKKTAIKRRLNIEFRRLLKGPLQLFSPKSISKDSLTNKTASGPVNKFGSQPVMALNGGYLNYAYNYRSATDTPYSEKNISQHNISGSTGLMIGGVVPVNVNFWIRRSNSILFKDITDVQLSFDPAGFRNRLMETVKSKIMLNAPAFNDSSLKRLSFLKSDELLQTSNFLQSSSNKQAVREYREMILIHAAHPENLPTDSNARKRMQQQLEVAAVFIKMYDSTRSRFDTLTSIVDSLRAKVDRNRREAAQYRQLLNGNLGGWSSYIDWRDKLDNRSPGQLHVPEQYRWLMGIRNFSLGKTPLNYSELTAKNISLSGLNFEYNSWYYLAFSAGLVDYRFRDFVVNNSNRSRQYLVMLRAGIGKLEKNYFIVSLIKGRKQLYSLPVNRNTSNSINITGVTVETKWAINPHTYIVAEIGQSLSPDYRSAPPVEQSKFSFHGNLNKALSVKLYSVFPKIHGRAEGLYKFTGANYQSFSSFQSNAAINTWYLKWEQSFFAKKVKITGSLRSNEFTNPYLLQNYKSNTIFKSINAVFRIHRLPIVSIGFMPLSQLSVVGQQVVENRFQSLTASLNHFYKIGTRRAFTSLIVNRFYNSSADIGFVYFNATNFYLSQNIAFKLYTAGISLADSKSSQYHLTSGEINLQVPLLRKLVAGAAIKLSHFNEKENKIGGRFNLDVNITPKDRIGINYERAYLPGAGKQLINSELGNIQYSRYF